VAVYSDLAFGRNLFIVREVELWLHLLSLIPALIPKNISEAFTAVSIESPTQQDCDVVQTGRTFSAFRKKLLLSFLRPENGPSNKKTTRWRTK
jgi:hypothetical protein